MATRSVPSLPVRPPHEPEPTGVAFPDVSTADAHGRVMIGGDLEPGTLLAAYRGGLFPMRQGNGELAWWSPHPRAVLRPDWLHVSHSLRRACHRFEIRVDTAFTSVLEGCADRAEGEYHWITDEIRTAYSRLHELGWAHSVEAWSRPANGEAPALAGGLYGVAIGGFFGGESMFSRQRDASKVTLVALVDLLRSGTEGGASCLIDVQWLTPHMASLGAREIAREDYLALLQRALASPPPPGRASPVAG